MFLHNRLHRLAALALLALVSACGDGGGGGGPPTETLPLVVTATGTLERGETVTMSATRGGAAVPAGSVTWTVVPATAGEVLNGGQIRLLSAGLVEVRGAYDGSTGSTQLQVTEPPGLVVLATGSVERGRTLTLSATRNGQPVPAGNVTWTVVPANAGEVLPGGQVRLLTSGPVQVNGTFGLSTGSLQLQVKEPGALVVTTAGSVERGRTITLSVTREGQAIPAGEVTWTISPAGAGELLPGGQVRLLTAGALQIDAAYDNSTGGVQLAVAEPPALVLSVTGRRERGSVLTVSATRAGQAVAAGDVAWTVTPAAAAEVLANGQVRLLAAGALQIGGSYDLSTGVLPVTVAAPPTIVFDMSVGGNRDVYSVALDGGDLTRLTDAPASDSDPTAAAGTVVFASLRAGGGFAELYAMPLAGGAATRLTTTARAETAPSLSADGQRLAYAYDVSGVYRIWTANANGAGASAYTGSLGFSGSPETSPSWAPTGNRLAFVGTAQGQADIWDLVSGGTARILAGGDPADVDPAWSPDGSAVAFASTREGDPAIFTVRLSDLQVTRLSSRAGSEAEPTWTADGRLVYVEFTSSTVTRLVWIDPAEPGTVHVIPVASGAPRRPSAVR